MSYPAWQAKRLVAASVPGRNSNDNMWWVTDLQEWYRPTRRSKHPPAASTASSARSSLQHHHEEMSQMPIIIPAATETCDGICTSLTA